MVYTGGVKTPLGILDQIALTASEKNRLASCVGSVLGGFIPVVCFIIAHYEVNTYPLLWVIVAAGMAYSATTVYGWGIIAFKHITKALGFVILVEGVAIFAHTIALGYMALAILVGINATSCAYALVSDRIETRAARKAPPVMLNKKVVLLHAIK